jgi:hypothetical protein
MVMMAQPIYSCLDIRSPEANGTSRPSPGRWPSWRSSSGVMTGFPPSHRRYRPSPRRRRSRPAPSDGAFLRSREKRNIRRESISRSRPGAASSRRPTVS